jgi:outer membrane protein assembly factor BamB
MLRTYPTSKTAFFIPLLLLVAPACGEAVLVPPAADGADGGAGGGPPQSSECGDMSGLAPGAWAMDGYCPTRHGRSPFVGPDAAVETATVFLPGWATAVAIGPDGTLFVSVSTPLNQPGLYAVTPRGELSWVVDSIDAVVTTPALGADGRVYVASGEALNAIEDGALVWSFATAGAMWSSPVIGADGAIYVGSDDGNLYAIEPSGAERWRLSTGGRVSSPALGFDGTVFAGSSAGSSDGRLHAVSPSGVEAWSLALDGWAGSPSIASDGTIYVTTDMTLYAISPDASIAWTLPVGRSYGQAIGVDDGVYVTTANGLLAVSAAGEALWTYPCEAYGAPTIDAAGNIYVTVPYDELHAIRPDGTRRWTFVGDRGAWVISRVPIGADGAVYLPNEYGVVHRIGGRAM